MKIPYSGRLSFCALLVVLCVVARAAVWPSAGFVQRDALFSQIAIQHLQRVLLHGGDWRATPLAWPLANPITQTDWMGGQALVGLPLHLAGIDPMRAYTLVSLLGLLLTAWACDRVAAALLGEGVHTWMAGIAGGFAPAQLLHAQHSNLVWHTFGPAGALLLVAGLRRDRRWLAALGGAACPLAFHFGAYVGLHAAAIIGVVSIFSAFYGVGSRRAWAAALAGFVLGALTVVPVAQAYLGGAAAGRFSPQELAAESVDLGAPSRPEFDPLFQGYTAFFLLYVGAVTVWRTGWAWGAVAVLIVVPLSFALGPWIVWEGQPIFGPAPWALLIHAVPPLGSLRSPARWVMVAVLAGSPLVAAGALRLTRTRAWLRWFLLAGLLAELPAVSAAALESVVPGRAYALVSASGTPGPLLDRLGHGCPDTAEQKLRAALDHDRALVGGQFARSTPELRAVNHQTDGWPGVETVQWLRANGVRLVLGEFLTA